MNAESREAKSREQKAEVIAKPLTEKQHHAAIDPRIEEVLRRAKWRRGFDPKGGIHGKHGHGFGHGTNVPLRHHQVHGRGN